MANVYFHPINGVNGNDGSQGSPKRDPWAYTQSAGDHLYLAASKDFIPPASASSAVPIQQDDVWIHSYGEGDNPARLYCPNVNRGVSISTDKKRWGIEDLIIDTVGAGTSMRGIVNGTTGSSETVEVRGTIRRVEIMNVLSDGANDCNGMALFGDYFTITDCKVHGIATDGIWLRARHAEIGFTDVWDVAQDDAVRGAFGDCIQFGGAGTSDFSGGYVHHCRLDHRSSKNVKNALIISAASGTTNFRAEFNEVWASVVTSQIAMYLDAPGMIARGNRVYGGDYGIYLPNASGGSAIGNHVSGSNSGIRTGSGSTGAKLWNNTVHDCGTGIYASPNDATTEIYNNLVLLCTVSGISRHGAMAEDYNWLYGNLVNQTQLGGTLTAGTNTKTTDPRGNLNADMTLRREGFSMASANPVAVAGTFRRSLVLRNGRPRPRFVPVGAYAARPPLAA